MSKRRLLVSVAVLTSAPLAPHVHAAVPEALLCNETKKVNCFRDEIYILDGAIEVPGKGPLAINCGTEKINGVEKPICIDMQFAAAAELAVGQIKEGGLPAVQWDTVSVFGADFPKSARVDGQGGGYGPWFFRPEGANQIRGIGLRGFRQPGRTASIGYIAAGSTTNFGTFIPPTTPPPAGLSRWPEPDPAGVEGFGEFYPRCNPTAYCFDGFHNGYQALASAVAQMYGPKLETGVDDREVRKSPNLAMLDYDDERLPKRKQLCNVPGFKNSNAAFAETRIWNSLLDFETSLMGGVHWRVNGDSTIESTLPTPFWEASPPYVGRPMLRFHPIELYLLGLAPFSSLKPIKDYTDTSGVLFPYSDLDERFGTSFSGLIENFGQFTDIKGQLLEFQAGLDVANNVAKTFSESDRLLDPLVVWGPEFGGRDPDFSEASHYHRMLWIVVTKPNDPQKTEEQINFMLRWRRAWNQYFYMLTSYRGRMLTTADATEDDSPYWEFAQPIDDEKTFVPTGGLTIQFPGPLPTPGTPVIASFARVLQTPGDQGAVTFQPHFNQRPLRIKGDQQHPGSINTFAARMRLPADAPRNSAAILQLAGGPSIRVPSDPGSFLIADGKFHTYSADLSKIPEFINRDFTGFSFVPSTAPAFDLDIEFIRFQHVKVEDNGDKDTSCDGAPKPDGFINTEDNCPNEYNPLQEDADNNGVGDACEDFDQDGAPNLCDNCPTLTNSRQRDRDDDGKGDACDNSPGGGCFLQPESIAGGSPRGWALGLLFALAFVARAARKRWRR